MRVEAIRAPETCVHEWDAHVVGASAFSVQFLTRRITALKQLPSFTGTKRKMRILEHTEALEPRIEAHAFIEDRPPPQRTGGGHEIDLAHPRERRLEAVVDRITALPVVAAGLEGRQQLQPPVPAPPLGGVKGEGRCAEDYKK